MQPRDRGERRVTLDPVRRESNLVFAQDPLRVGPTTQLEPRHRRRLSGCGCDRGQSDLYPEGTSTPVMEAKEKLSDDQNLELEKLMDPSQPSNLADRINDMEKVGPSCRSQRGKADTRKDLNSIHSGGDHRR